MPKHHKLYLAFTAHRILALCGALSLAQLAYASDVMLHGQQQSVVVHENDGSYEIVGESLHHAVIHARAGVKLNQRWITSSYYPEHKIQQSAFEDALGRGHQVRVLCTGLASQPDLAYVIRLYETMPAGDIEVEVLNHIG